MSTKRRNRNAIRRRLRRLAKTDFGGPLRVGNSIHKIGYGTGVGRSNRTKEAP